MSAWEMKIIRAEVDRLMVLAAEDEDLRVELRALAGSILAATDGAQPSAATISGWETKIILAEADRLMALADDDEDLRVELRALAESILAATDVAQPSAATMALFPVPTVPETSPSIPVPQTDEAQAPEPLRELTLGRSRPAPAEQPHVPGPRIGPGMIDAELPHIEASCRRKAEATRWAADRQNRIREGDYFEVETPATVREIAAWVDQLTDCFYWTNAAEPAPISLLDDLGGCFETLAGAVALVRDIPDDLGAHRALFEHSLPLIAEAQSAVRAAIQSIRGPDDPDQLQVFEWLKATAARHHVYIKRFMRADDPANPTRWPDLLARIERVDTQHGKKRSPQHGAWIDRLQSLSKRIQEGNATQQDWPSIIQTVDEMLGAGVPPSNREIRELLLPVIETLPDRDDLPDGFRLVLREFDHYLATRPAASSAAPTHEPTDEVKEASRLLAHRSAVLIGGACRRVSQKVLKAALGLKELIWIETKEHQSVATFEPAIARPDVALVLLAIRWSSHAFGEVREFCDRYNKPLVRLPGGYNPNQVAAQILAQCSDRLRDD
jgi:hypothetical protein